MLACDKFYLKNTVYNVDYNYKQVFSQGIPVIFHGLKGYDSHLVNQALTDEYKKVSCIPTNTEKYVTFSINKLKFIDSYAFLASSLETLVYNLAQKWTPTSFKHLKNDFNGITEYKLWLLSRKGIYPYDYICSLHF